MSSPVTSIDDPRLTAYALGECDEADRQAVERAILSDPDLRRELEDIRETCGVLQADLGAASATEGLGDQRRASVLAQAAGRSSWRPWPLAAVALLGVAVGVTVFTTSLPEERPPVAVSQLDPGEAPSDAQPDQSFAPVQPGEQPTVTEVDVPDVRYRMRYDGRLPSVFGYATTSREVGASAVTEIPATGRSSQTEFSYMATGSFVQMVPDASSTERYHLPTETGFIRVADDPQRPSTFSVDVDTASYSNLRRMLRQGLMPPPESVRIEEMINYFPYSYPTPAWDAEAPFGVDASFGSCPWQPEHRLLRIAVQGKDIPVTEREGVNLVFLIDVSGSMRSADKLPLLKDSFKMLAGGLDERDRVAIVTYAGSSGLVLPATPGNEQLKIMTALDQLQSGGSTAGAAGITLAYQVAREHFIEGGVNRVILATDGDFNVGISDRSELVKLVEREAQTGVELSVLGFGGGNLNDAMMEDITNKGNGNYHYIDTLAEGEKVLCEDMLGTLITIAKDVKIQLFFNPAKVGAWRLVGYDNRRLAAEDFNDDTKDAGEIGAGHTVTALYEIIPVGVAVPRQVDANPFVEGPEQKQTGDPAAAAVQVRLRHKPPGGDTSSLIEIESEVAVREFTELDGDFRWAALVAGFGLVLRESEYAGVLNWETLGQLAEQCSEDVGGDPYRQELLDLIDRAIQLSAK